MDIVLCAYKRISLDDKYFMVIFVIEVEQKIGK